MKNIWSVSQRKIEKIPRFDKPSTCLTRMEKYLEVSLKSIPTSERNSSAKKQRWSRKCFKVIHDMKV